MIPRWIYSLKKAVEDVENGKYYTDGNVSDIIEYYEEQYLMHEEDMTFKEAEMVERYIEQLKKKGAAHV